MAAGCQWKSAKFDFSQIRNPSADRHKIWNKWLRSRDDPSAKFRKHLSINAFKQKSKKIKKILKKYILMARLQVRQPGFFTHDGSNDVVSPKGVSFRGRYLTPEKSLKPKISPKTNFKIFGPKTLLYKIIHL